MREKINRVLFDNGADFNDIDLAYLIKFCEEKLESLSLEMDEYYNIYKDIEKICRFTVKLRLKGLDYNKKIADLIDEFSITTGTSFENSMNVFGSAMVKTASAVASAGISMQQVGRALRDLGSKL